jgi:putative glutamine amidotransferase
LNHDLGRAEVAAHDVALDPESKLARIFKSAGALPAGDSPHITVNSSHHQAVDLVGDGLRLSAWSAADHVKEAVEGTADDHFVLCVQWHPERTYDSDPASRAMFQAFVNAAAEWHKKLALKQQDFESLPGKH